MTPLKGADGQVYAMAQGNLLVGGVGAASGGSKVQVNHLSVGRIPAGATVERAVQTVLGQGDYINLELNTTDFTTATRIVETINRELSPDQGNRCCTGWPYDKSARAGWQCTRGLYVPGRKFAN